ncbi:MAG: hypothetical protein M1544_01695 [Candidatus Marsarchaeota archaeon]|nr:hypothetical protein [Candidatus Marsarchaeota archaeon]MCL5102049.1 hypothetical protein [Candidatus Marsarchaeota archaeon]
MSYQETIDAHIKHHRGIAEKMERSMGKKMAPEMEEKFEKAHELMKGYEFRLVPKNR